MNRILQRRRRLKMMGTGYPYVAPASLSGLVGWWDASVTASLWQDSARTTPVTATGEPVGAWDDQSGNSRHLTQATAGARPTYKPTDVLGAAGLSFDGGDYLFSSAAWVASVYAGTNLPIGIFAVVQLNPETGTQTIASIGNSAASVGFRGFRTSTGAVQLTSTPDGGGNVANTASTDRLTTNAAIAGVYCDGTPLTELFVNQSRVYGPLAAGTGAFTIDRFALGVLLRNSTANFLTGYLSEVIAVSSITASEKLGIQRYLYEKWW